MAEGVGVWLPRGDLRGEGGCSGVGSGGVWVLPPVPGGGSRERRVQNTGKTPGPLPGPSPRRGLPHLSLFGWGFFILF